MYGASFQMKVIAKLVNSAIALFRKNALPQEFFDDERSARAWLKESKEKQAAGGQ
jgi:hypothetical protein